MRRALLSFLLFAAPPFIAVAPCPAGAQDASNPSFNLRNRGREPVVELYATPSRNNRWGTDRLTRFSVPPGGTFPVRLPAGEDCSYDIKVVYAGGRSEEMRRVDTCAADSVSVPGGARSAQAERGGGGNDPSFRLVNRGRREVNELYASPAGDDEWGSDRLGSDTVGAGATFVVRLPPGKCSWDVRVVFDNGDAVERRKVDLCRLTDFRVP